MRFSRKPIVLAAILAVCVVAVCAALVKIPSVSDTSTDGSSSSTSFNAFSSHPFDSALSDTHDTTTTLDGSTANPQPTSQTTPVSSESETGTDGEGDAGIEVVEDESGNSYVSGELIVTMKAGTNQADIDAIATKLGAVSVETLSNLGDYGAVVLFGLPDGLTVEDAQALIADDDTIVNSQKNRVYSVADDTAADTNQGNGSVGGSTSGTSSETIGGSALDDTTYATLDEGSTTATASTTGDATDTTSADTSGESATIPISANTTGISDPEATNQWALGDLSAYRVWDIVKCNNTVTVAVIDTGIDMDHPDLVSNIVAPYDTVDNDYVPDDKVGHGTHVAGIISACSNNGIGVSGVSYNANIMPIGVFFYTKVYGYITTTDYLVKAYAYLLGNAGSDVNGDGVIGSVADEYNVHVINMSLGGVGTTSSDGVLEQKIDQAYADDILTVCAAGNSSSNVSVPYDDYPADYDTCISVMALDSSGSLASYSNYNAPGSTAKDICAPGTSILSTTLNGGYVRLSGTSMASPFVAGTAALLFAYKPNLSVGNIRAALLGTAKDLGSTGWDEEFGYGEVDPLEALENLSTWTRIAGEDRYRTMSKLVSYAYPDEGSCDSLIITRGDNYPDALCASALAGTLDCPIITTTSDSLGASAKSQIKRLANSSTKVYVLGDSNSVSDSAVAEITTLAKTTGLNFSVTRIAGSDRIATCLAIYAQGEGSWNKETCIVTSGENYPDALSIASYAFATKTPLFLTTGGTLSDDEASAIREAGFTQVIILGGTNSVSDSVKDQLGSSATYLRLGGTDRYETSRLIIGWETGGMTDAAFQPSVKMAYNGMAITTGSKFADALTSSPLLGGTDSVLLLADDAVSTDEIDTIVGANATAIKKGYILGGTDSVSNDIEILCFSAMNAS